MSDCAFLPSYLTSKPANHNNIPTPIAATRAPQALLPVLPAEPVCVLPFGDVVVAPLPPGPPPGAVGVATTKLVRVCAPPPGRLVVTRTTLEVGAGVGPVEGAVVRAVFVVERLLEAVLEIVVGIVETDVTVVDGVPEAVVVMVVGTVEMEMEDEDVMVVVLLVGEFLLKTTASATDGRKRRAAARILIDSSDSELRIKSCRSFGRCFELAR